MQTTPSTPTINQTTYTAHAARQIAMRYGNAIFARDNLPADLRVLFTSEPYPILEYVHDMRGLRLSILGRSFASSKTRTYDPAFDYRNVNSEAYSDVLEYWHAIIR